MAKEWELNGILPNDKELENYYHVISRNYVTQYPGFDKVREVIIDVISIDYDELIFAVISYVERDDIEEQPRVFTRIISFDYKLSTGITMLPKH